MSWLNTDDVRKEFNASSEKVLVVLFPPLVIFVRCSRVCPVYFFLCNPGRLE